MIFGRKARTTADEAGIEAIGDDPRTDVDDVADGDVADADAEAETDDAEDADPGDPRADGPFDSEEVDLDGDVVERITFGPLVITPFEGLNVPLHGDPQTGTIQALLAAYDNSGLEVALFAAPRTGGLADELREETIEEAGQQGGHAEAAAGPFGTEVRRVLPMEGPEGEQLFHVSRIWLVEGPRWLLRGTLMGRAAMAEGEPARADIFVEFFRNLVVLRDEQPRVPGELIHLALPEGPPQG